jgi:hypothetical protein
VEDSAYSLVRTLYGMIQSHMHSTIQYSRKPVRERLRKNSTSHSTTIDLPCRRLCVVSPSHVRFMPVVCGVHTSLLLHVDCSEDDVFCFGGVARGSVELVPTV